MSKIVTGAVAVAALIIVAGAAASSATATSTPPAPPRPEWVNADGTTDVSKVPDKLPVMDSDGNPLKGKDGNQVYVPSGIQPPVSGPRVASDTPGVKRWTETDSNGNTIEHAEVEPTAPAAD
ncbi:hypothetical protein [Streptomyces sp. NPDC057580]|uniref:hypothetical protein n=1 Tax=Streptomyces sp. NPDC057580 TaxID=3346173 RepID=UPI0036C1558C